MERLTEYDVYPIEVGDIFLDPEFNCRDQFTLESVQDLSESIQTHGGYPHGLKFQVIVQTYDRQPGFRYRLVCGYRRFTACTRFLKWPLIPAQIRTLTDEEAWVLNFTENLERKDLNILEQAKTIAKRFPGQALAEIARVLSRPKRWVHALRKLLDLPEKVQAMAAAEEITLANIESLWVIDNPARQLEAAYEIARAKAKGKFRPLSNLPEDCRRKFRYRKTKQQLSDMIRWLLERRIDLSSPLTTRVLVWAGSLITDEEFRQDAENWLTEHHADVVKKICRPRNRRPRKSS